MFYIQEMCRQIHQIKPFYLEFGTGKTLNKSITNLKKVCVGYHLYNTVNLNIFILAAHEKAAVENKSMRVLNSRIGSFAMQEKQY